MNPAHECLYDVAWQLRRNGYVKGWHTEEGTRANILDMLAYIGKGRTRYWKFIRVWRCMNVVGNGIATAEKYENPIGVRLLKTLRQGLEIDYHRYRDAIIGTPFYAWSWKKVHTDLVRLYITDFPMFSRLQGMSERRLYSTGKEYPTDPASRPELARFIRMLRDVVFERT